VRHLIRRLARNSTVLLSTHILSEVEAVCDRVIILMNGEIKADARLSDLASTTDVVVVLGDGAPDVTARLKALPDAGAVEPVPSADGTAYRVRPLGSSNGVDLRPAIYDLARDAGWPLKELRREVRTLEAVFNELATTAQVGGGA